MVFWEQHDVLRDTLERMLEEVLEPREVLVIKLRSGFDDGRLRTLDDVANMLGTTWEGVREIELGALRKLSGSPLPLPKNIYEYIYGPKKNWSCHCGKYTGFRFRRIICDRCSVEVCLNLAVVNTVDYDAVYIEWRQWKQKHDELVRLDNKRRNDEFNAKQPRAPQPSYHLLVVGADGSRTAYGADGNEVKEKG